MTVLDLYAELRTKILADSSVTDLVSSRVSNGMLPQNQTLPAIVAHIIDGFSEQHLGGMVGHATSRVQIDCYATTQQAADELAETVRLSLQTFRGTMGTFFVSVISLTGGLRHAHDRVESGTDTYRFIASQDFTIHHSQATS